MLVGGGGDQHEPLGVADDLRGVERVAGPSSTNPVPAGDPWLGPGEHGRGARPLLGEGRHHAGVDRLGDEGGRRPPARMRGDHRPLPGALLAGGVEDLVDQRLPVSSSDGEDVGGDLDRGTSRARPRFQLAEDVGHLGGATAASPSSQQVVRLGDELHVAVLDAVVDHLHEVAGAVGADPVTARRRRPSTLAAIAVKMSAHLRASVGRAAGHDRRPVTGALFAAGDADADEAQALGLERRRSRRMVSVKRELPPSMTMSPGSSSGTSCVDEGVDGAPGLHHQHHLARGLPAAATSSVQRSRRHDLGPVALAAGERLGDRRRAVVDGDSVAMVGHVEDQVLAHHGQPDEPEVGGLHCVTVSRAREPGRDSRRPATTLGVGANGGVTGMPVQ